MGSQRQQYMLVRYQFGQLHAGCIGAGAVGPTPRTNQSLRPPPRNRKVGNRKKLLPCVRTAK
jgi:hypothetical protein